MSEPTSAVAKTLAKVPIFSGLTEGELNFLAQRTVPRNYAAGQSVFGEGELCSGLYVVESGHVRIFKSSANGREQVLSIDGPGSSIAELPVFDGGNYPASVTAIDEATLLFVSKQDFQALCVAHPQVALKVLRVVGSRLRRLVGIIEELSFTASQAGFIFVTSRSQGWEALRLGCGNHLASQQPGTGIAHWHRPRASLTQSLSLPGRGYLADRRADGDDLRSESTGSRNRFTGIHLRSSTLSFIVLSDSPILTFLEKFARDKSHRHGAAAPLP